MTKKPQMYEIEYAPRINHPLPGLLMLPDALLSSVIETIKSDQNWAYYKIYKLSEVDVKNDTKGKLVKEWVRGRDE